MKEIILYTKKVRLNFNADGVSVFDVQKVIDEVEKEYKLMDGFPAISTFEEFQYITFRVVKKDDAKRPLGFSLTK